jgi:AcrR family transcriptional regulator
MKRPETSHRGRPRSFDERAALEAALSVFWKHGYEGASLAELTAAMGINRPSLYAAFGNKEELFRRALDHYTAGAAALHDSALRQPTARAAVEKLLRSAADALGDCKNPRGCLLVQSALVCGTAGESVKQELIARRASVRAAWRKRFQKARMDGDLPADADPAALARYLSALSAGMAVEAVNGADRAELRRLVDVALRAWPA